MNLFKSISAVALTALSFSVQAMANFDLVNSFPAIPVYYKLNNEPCWRTLDNANYRITRNIPQDETLNVTFSANQDGSNPTYFMFSPTIAATCYIQVSVGYPSRTIMIAPQNTSPVNRSKTRFGLSLYRNITPSAIEACKNQARTMALAVTASSRLIISSPATIQRTNAPVQSPKATAGAPTPSPAIAKPRATAISTPTAIAPTVRHAELDETIEQSSSSKARRLSSCSSTATPRAMQQIPASTTAPVDPIIPMASNQPDSTPPIAIIPCRATPTPMLLIGLPAREIAQQDVHDQNPANIIDSFFNLLSNTANRVGLSGRYQLYDSQRDATAARFKNLVRTNHNLETNENNLIDLMWQTIITTRPPADAIGSVIMTHITHILTRGPADNQDAAPFMQDVHTPQELLAKWENQLPQEGAEREAWNALSPMHKLYYGKLIEFYHQFCVVHN